MTEIMRAVRFHGKTDIRLESIATPKCGKDQVKVGIARIKLARAQAKHSLLIYLVLDKACIRWHLWNG